MEHLTFDYPAQRAVTTRAHVGVVGSGDLEVLLSPAAADAGGSALAAHVVVRTSVDGYSHIWKSVLDRFFTRYDGAAHIEINDFRVPVVAPPVQFDGGRGQPRRAPELGEDTEAVLLALGLGWDDIAPLKDSGAIL